MIRYLWMLSLPIILLADIDAQIEAIQSASVEERFKLMNAFKQEIIKMHQEERSQAIEKLQSMTKSPHTQQSIEHLKSPTHKDIPEHALEHEIETHVDAEKIETDIEELHQPQISEEHEPEIEIEEHIEQEEIETETEVENQIDETFQEEVEDEAQEHEEKEDDD